MNSHISNEGQTGNAVVPVFDGHNDVLTQLRDSYGVSGAAAFLEETSFHIDSVKAVKGGFAGGFFAMWVDSPGEESFEAMMLESQYDIPLPAQISQELALGVVMEQAAILLKLQDLGALKVCQTAVELRSAISNGMLAAVMHLEGCEAIDENFHNLDVLYAAGLRSLGPVWSRSNIFGHGVPFRYPSNPDIGDGLTELGFELVRRCNKLGVLIDLSHLNEKGFNDVAKTSNAPLVATHSNVHSLCTHARNLHDGQLEIIKASNGMVGLNFACAFLREDGRMLSDVPIEQMLRHLDYLIEHLGEDGVGLGSDFDGATVPEAISSCAGLQVLVESMREHGYGETLISKLCFSNWMSVLERTWQAD